MKKFRFLLLLLIFLSTMACGLLQLEWLGTDSSPVTQQTPESAVPAGQEVPSAESLWPLPDEQTSATAQSSPQQQTNYRYGVQPGSPTRTSSWLHDCKWMGVAGQVFGSDGVPVDGIIVEAGGRLIGQPILGLSITGIENGYGPGGYEIKLADQPLKSSQLIWIQLKDTAGQPLSPQIYLHTSDVCAENLVLLNFIEGGPPSDQFEYYLPILNK